MATASQPFDLGVALEAFLAGDPAARQTLPTHLHEHLVDLAAQVAPDLAEEDLAEDVAQEVGSICSPPTWPAWSSTTRRRWTSSSSA